MIDLGTFIQPELGWILVLAYGAYEIHYGRIGDTLDRVDEKITALVHAVRAITTALNTGRAVDSEAIDEHLVEDAEISADDFLRDREVVPDGGESDHDLDHDDVEDGNP